MTETMTADDVRRSSEYVNGPDLDPQPPQNLPDVAAVPTNKQAFSLAVRRMLGLEDASDGEIELFFHVCHKSGLDPFNKEVYMIGRNTEVANWEPVNEDEPDGQKRKVKRWVTKYTIQTAINGFRKRAREIADGKGIRYSQDAPMWCGEDEVWKQVWPEKKPPVAAKFTVYRDGDPYTFIAHYDEYEQQVKVDGSFVPNAMWKKMPRNQIRKCAEAGAIQAAFPDELGGLLLEDAVQDDMVILDEDGTQVQEPKQKRRGGKGVGGLADRAREAQQQPDEPQIVEGEVTDEEHAEPAAASANQMSPASRKKWENRMFQLLGEANVKERGDQLVIIAGLSGRAINPLVLEHRTDINDDELRNVVNALNGWAKKGTTDAEVREILNGATLAEDGSQTDDEPAAGDNQEGTLL